MKLSELAKLKAPAGWKWETKPALRVRGTIILDTNNAIGGKKGVNERVNSLHKWAVENKLGLVPDNSLGGASSASVMIYYYRDFLQARYKVSVSKPETTSDWFGDSTCASCEQVLGVGEVVCPNCDQIQSCQGCGKVGWRHFKVRSVLRNRFNYLCAECAPVCSKEGCSTRQWSREYGTKYQGLCAEHCPVTKCPICGIAFDKSKGVSCTYRSGQMKICPTCADKSVCKECNIYSPSVSRNTKRFCKACALAHVDKDIEKYATFPLSELPKGGSLIIKDLPERPYRIMSIETEMDGTKDILAGVLYRCGIVKVPEVESYNSYPDPSTPWAAHLKHDGSVTAGELIFHCLNLDTQEHADVLLNVLSKLRGLEKAKQINFGSGCGGHIHIDAHNFGYGDVWRLITIWNYLEDVIYRLAGAGHEHGHRSLDPNYRPYNGVGYTHSTVKGPFGSKALATQSVQGQARHSGLNFVPYIQAQNNCSCGVFGRGGADGRDCKCNLGKRTIEWRVWNSTGNPRILHSWMALMQAVHAYCDTGEDPTAEWEKEFPPMPFTRRKYDVVNNKATKERLEWIFRNLMLTNDERDSLIYTIKQSELKTLGTEFINDLSKIVPVHAFPVKAAVKHHAKRTVAIKVVAPSEAKKVKAEARVQNAQADFGLWANTFVTANRR